MQVVSPPRAVPGKGRKSDSGAAPRSFAARNDRPIESPCYFYRYYGKDIGRAEAPRTISMGLFGILHCNPREKYLGRIRLLSYDGQLSAEQHLTRCNLATLLSDTEAMRMTSSVCIA